MYVCGWLGRDMKAIGVRGVQTRLKKYIFSEGRKRAESPIFILFEADWRKAWMILS